ncbi:dihydrodipicolinate synthase family protein [Maribellus luteus]|uniref:Dihydrodipicolinate synthase family protein n=1 Tax=Maribellus luteus TaxID=2305463 RepID=A0A399SXK8_9BACT|nr:dihydrodipicolinate synthase family protein [Maribellus luteus]RIJ46965.1 dihydrodipicolinate synthase family protein [Maribellus luteus]
MNSSLKGIIPPIVTPLINEEELDESGLARLIEYLISGGVHGIFLLGTTGEATSLSYSLRREFVEKACAFINKRVPVMVGVTDTSAAGLLEMAHVSKSAGADALVISSPYYLPISQNEFVDFLKNISPKLPLPFLLYNMPSCTKMHMSVETVRQAKELGAIGIKDSSGDLAYFYTLLDEFKNETDFAVICGTELFLPESVNFGGSGGITGGANIFPRLFVDMYKASLDGDLNKVARLRDIVIQIEKKIYNISADSSRYIESIKCALSVLGICSGYVAQPFSGFEEAQKQQMQVNIKELAEMYPELNEEISMLNSIT